MFKYYASSDRWPPGDGDAKCLKEIIENAKEVNREDFLEHVDKESVSDAEKLKKDDGQITYYKSKLNDNDETVYYLEHSGIQYVFKLG